MGKKEILEQLKLFKLEDGGFGSWIAENTDSDVFARLDRVDQEPITKVQLNQLLAFGHEAPVSEGFFGYYWIKCPKKHPYDVTSVPHFKKEWCDASAICSIEHLKWGLYRIYIDALLWFGNVRTGFRSLRMLSVTELEEFFASKRCDTELIKGRGPALPLKSIAKDDRYLIAEMACKSYGDDASSSDLRLALIEAFREHQKKDRSPVKIGDLLKGSFRRGNTKTDKRSSSFRRTTSLKRRSRHKKSWRKSSKRLRESFLMRAKRL